MKETSASISELWRILSVNCMNKQMLNMVMRGFNIFTVK